jgi:endoglucanase
MFKKKHMSLYIVAGLFLFTAVGCVETEESKQPIVKKTCPTDKPLGRRAAPNPFEQNERLGIGVNLGNALEAPNEGDWDVVLQQEYFEIIKDAGFDSIRVPCRWSVHALEQPPYTIDTAFFERVDWVIENAFQNDLYVMLNMHHYYELTDDPAGHSKRFYALWRQIAEHYKDYPDALLLELLNEPGGKMRLQGWNRILKKSLSVVRKSNPNRTIVVGPYNLNKVEYLKKLEIPEKDRNIIVSVHYYEPSQFTHQGADWLGEHTKAWLGTKWMGTDRDKHAITKAFDRAVAWGKKHNRPINLGEFGAIEKADMASRIRWTEFVAKSAAERDWSYIYWEFCHLNFGVYDPETEIWKEPLLKAILQKD